jgi:hypothetical protein
MKMQDIWFLLLISVIVAHLRLVGVVKGFKSATKLVPIRPHNNRMFWVTLETVVSNENKKCVTEQSLAVICQTEVHLVLATPQAINCHR